MNCLCILRKGTRGAFLQADLNLNFEIQVKSEKLEYIGVYSNIFKFTWIYSSSLEYIQVFRRSLEYFKKTKWWICVKLIEIYHNGSEPNSAQLFLVPRVIGGWNCNSGRYNVPTPYWFQNWNLYGALREKFPFFDPLLKVDHNGSGSNSVQLFLVPRDIDGWNSNHGECSVPTL